MAGNFKRTTAGDAAWELVDDAEGYYIGRVAQDSEGVDHVFKSDLEAAGYVLMCAIEGDAAAQDAINVIYDAPVPLVTREIKRIVRNDLQRVTVVFEDTRYASQFEVELHELKESQD